MGKKDYVLLAVSLCLFAGVCSAQLFGSRNRKKFSIGYSEGQDIPVSTFGSPDKSKLPLSRFSKQDSPDTNHLSGYALSGFHFDVYASYKIIPYLGVMLFWGGDALPYNVNELNAQYIQFFPPNTTSATADGSYFVEQYLGGACLELPIYGNFIYEFKALAGITTTLYPGITYLSGLGGTPSAQETTIYRISQNDAFGYNIGTGIKFLVADGVMGLHLDIDYAASTITYPNYSLSIFDLSSGNYLGSTTYNAPKSLSINLFMLTFGVSVEF